MRAMESEFEIFSPVRKFHMKEIYLWSMYFAYDQLDIIIVYIALSIPVQEIKTNLRFPHS